ncbi:MULTISPECIES: LptA/OstA family protein [Falsihalocynthiibacter]|uniref:LptA/OstA family protein n=1 Tax=Falsihalocynthiibacter TaxID=2854182 RepID=UPI003001367F
MRAILAIFLLIGFAGSTFAQGTQIPFGGYEHNASLPVEVISDALEVDQETGNATFVGNVVIGQGEMRLNASKVVVEYKTGADQTGGKISRMVASGGVVLVNGPEAAEADEAVYSIDNAEITMSGNVILTQGNNALSSTQMVVDLNTGRAQMTGRVKTILQPEN